MATMTLLTPVNWFTKSVVVLMLALWVPATMHCTLETMPGFSFLEWCCGGEEASQPQQDCNEDACGAVESGLYKTEDNYSFTSGLALLLELSAGEWVAEPPAEFAPPVASVSSAPPELARFWQFSYRTALPPRAPSIVA